MTPWRFFGSIALERESWQTGTEKKEKSSDTEQTLHAPLSLVVCRDYGLTVAIVIVVLRMPTKILKIWTPVGCQFGSRPVRFGWMKPSLGVYSPWLWDRPAVLGGFKCSISLPIVVNAMYCAGVPDEPANKANMLTKRGRPGRPIHCTTALEWMCLSA